MKYKIIADSGSNVTTLADTDFASVPITIMAGGKEYIDDAALDILAMTDELRKLSTKSSTACPNIDQWLTALVKLISSLRSRSPAHYRGAIRLLCKHENNI